MDSGDIVLQQPVATLPDLMDDIRDTREGAPAVIEATLPYPAEPMAFRSKLEPVLALAEQKIAVSEAPTAALSQDDTDMTDDGGESVKQLDENGNAVKAVGSSVLAETAAVQQIEETVDIEVDIPAPAAEAESRLLERTVVLISDMPSSHEGGHVGLLIEQAGGRSNADGIDVEVILNEAGPAGSDAQFVPSPEGSGNPGEISSDIGIGIVEPRPASIDTQSLRSADGGDGLGEIPSDKKIEFLGSSSNADENAGSHLTPQTGNAGRSVVMVAAVGEGALAAVNSPTISRVAELGEAGSGAAVRKELAVSPIAELTANEIAELAVNPTAELEEHAGQLVIPIFEGGDVPIVERNSATIMRVEDENSIEVPELERVEAVRTCDRISVDDTKVADNALNVRDSSVTRMVRGSTVETNPSPELDDGFPSEDMKGDGLVDPVGARNETAISGQDGEIVVEVVAPMTPEEGLGMAESEELRMVPVPLDTAEAALNSDGAVNSNEKTVSEDQSLIFVQSDHSIAVINSENLDVADTPGTVLEVTIPAGEDSVAALATLDHCEDAERVAIDVTETIEESIAIVPAPKDPNNPGMVDIPHPSSIVEELDRVSKITSISTSNELQEENRGSRIEKKSREELSTGKRTGLADVQVDQVVPEFHTATKRQGILINPERTGTNETFSVLSVETVAHIPGTADDANVDEVQLQATLSTDFMYMSPPKSPLNEGTLAELDRTQHIAGPDVPPGSTEQTAAPSETAILPPPDKILEYQERTAVESAERTEEPTVTAFQKLTTELEEHVGIQGDEIADIVNAVEPMEVKEIDTKMVSASLEEGQQAFTVTESIKAEDSTTAMDDHITSPVGVVAVEETIDIYSKATTASVSNTRDDQGEEESAAEDVEAQGGLIGVGSSVESSGLTITEIAETAVIFQGFQAERLSSWRLSEPLITPPEEEIIEAIGDLPVVDDSILDTEPETTEGWVLVAADDDPEINSQPVSVESAPSELDTSGYLNQDQQAALNDAMLDDIQQRATNPHDTVLLAPGDGGEPHDRQDGHSLETQAAAAADIANLASPTVSSLPESKQAADVIAETTPENVSAAIAELEKVLSIGEDVLTRQSAESLEARHKVAVGTDPLAASEAGSIPILMSSFDVEKALSVDETATQVIQRLRTAGEEKRNIAEGVTEPVVPSADRLGHGMETAGMAPLESDVERSEKKRVREDEGAAAEDEEKTAKAAKTISNGEISVLIDSEATDLTAAEDALVDKKRPRDELEAETATTVSLQAKVQKIGSADDDAPSQVRKGDTETETEAEECVDMDEKEDVQEKSVNGAGQPKYKKRKIALFLGYSGAGYQGMQKNPGAITIEGELETALYRAGAIAESNYGQPQKVDWRRAARTDKGVSAVGQVVSGCFFIDPPGFVDRVNSHLPKQIRVYGYKRATASFNAKKLCDRRKYEYVLPVYAFDPTVHLDRVTAQALAAVDKLQSMTATETKTVTTVATVSTPAVETEAAVSAVTLDSEMKDGDVTRDDGDVSNGGATVTGTPDVEGKEENQSCSNGMCAITEDVTVITEIAEGAGAAGESVQTQEVLTERKDVTVVTDCAMETVEVANLEVGDTVDGKASSASPGQVLVEVQEVLTEQKEVTIAEAVADVSIEEAKEALDEKVKKSTYKFGDSEFDRLNKILRGYEGNHNFHNFTARTKATDPSANRYIVSFGVENTFTIDGIEFVRCSVVGQSFMLHQIRKMIGLAVAIMRGSAPESILATALRRDTKVNVPMAPELGLFLEECYYTAYNRRFQASHEKMSLSSFPDEVREFKKEFIYPHIGSTEARDSTFAMWLHSLNDRHYPDFVTAREAEKVAKTN